MKFSACAIIPSHNHHLRIAGVIDAVKRQGLPVYLIDDGSTEPTKSALAALDDPQNGVHLYRFARNGGKGRAVIHGFRIAKDAGYSHGIQIDADRQHDVGSLPELLRLAKTEPEALISGQPVYDATILNSRRFARWITHIWVWIETLSTHIADSMCGYRAYPLATVLAVIDRYSIGQRMDFDTEIMVRMSWEGVPIRMLPVRVTYPAGNISNFDLLVDNWRITQMHGRLVCSMILNFSKVWKNRPKKTRQPYHWARLNERGVAWGLGFIFALYKLLGKKICWYAIQPVLLYFFIIGSEQRQASRNYWRRIYKISGQTGEADLWRLWQHYRSFGYMVLDKLAAWFGDITTGDLIFDNMEELGRIAEADTGVVVLTSHLGNVEVSRALACKRGANAITIFAHTRNATRFNKLLAAYNPAAAVDVLEVEDIGPTTLLELEDRLARGHWIVIAADRIPVVSNKRIGLMPFLGSPAPFSLGPVIIASLLKCPVYVMNCLKEGDKYRICFQKMAERITLPRNTRDVAAAKYVREYARQLEEICLKYPEQWYNFYDFWAGLDE